MSSVRTRRRRKAWMNAVRFVAALAITVVFLFPVYWLFMTAFKSPEEIFSNPPTWFPSAIHWVNFRDLAEDGDLRSIWNSVVIASVSTVLAMLLGTMAAYSLARFRTGGEKLAVWAISVRMVPPIVLAFPLFLMFASLGLVDTYEALIAIYVTINLPYVIWMMRGFIEDIPRELEDSALIDGCSRWQALVRVVFPMARTGLVATAVFAFVYAFNEFAFAIVMTRLEVVTFPVQITHHFQPMSTFWGRIGAMSIFGCLPVFFMIIAMNRFLVRGLSGGALKG
ncbi:MAG TPA: carbohydrate ABC transporter permease [Casimicrobiaceae bacterium]|nr:carbohydrate ABC transporter permease [Casimicrobiaceae bacterium]